MSSTRSKRDNASGFHPETTCSAAQYVTKANDPRSALFCSNENDCDAKIILVNKQDSPVVSALNTLPLLNLTTAKQDRQRFHKRGRSGAPPTCESGDNQTTHLSRRRQFVRNATAEKAKSWAYAVGSLSSDVNESLLPYLAVKAVVPSPQKLNSPLQKLHTRRTWNGSLKLQDVAGTSHPGHGIMLQRHHSNSDDTLATFQVTETIILAEIDSDERCASFLRQRARETLPDGDDATQSQLHYKLRALDRKIQMNQEKLAQVRERIAALGGKPSCLVIGLDEKPERNDNSTKKTKQNKKQLSRANQQLKASGSEKTLPVVSAALMIQCAYRAFQARRQLADLLAKTYQRILNPGNDQYFYYNRITRQSQWEAPWLLHRRYCLLDVKPKATTNSSRTSDPTLHAAAKVIQTMFRQQALRVFAQDLEHGNLEKVYDVGFGAWYYYNSRTNRSFWESVHHVQLTAANSAIYHRQQPS